MPSFVIIVTFLYEYTTLNQSRELLENHLDIIAIKYNPSNMLPLFVMV